MSFMLPPTLLPAEPRGSSEAAGGDDSPHGTVTAPVSANFLRQVLQAAELAVESRSPAQVLGWAQGALDELLPHAVLVTALQQGGIWQAAQIVGSEDALAQAGLIGGLDAAFSGELSRVWREGGEVPRALSFAQRAALLPALDARLQAALLHGWRYGGLDPSPVARQDACVFLLLGEVELSAPAHLQAAALLAPYVQFVARRMLEPVVESAGATRAPQNLFSGREVEILQWVFEGKTNQEIGFILNISPFTVKNHIQRIFRKLDVANRAQAVARALSLGLVQQQRARNTDMGQ